MKRLSVAAFIMAVTVILSGCSVMSLEGSDIMCPPKATGTKSDIQKLIDSETSGEYTLKYPKSGSNRSSIVLCDIDADENEEAVAFYTTQDKKLHMLFVQCDSGKHRVADDIICEGTEIDTVEFADIDGDKVKEVLIGYSSSTSSQNTLTVYHFDDAVKQLDAFCSYSYMVIGDYNYDSRSDILLLSLYSGDSQAIAKLMVYNENFGLSEIGTTELDSDITQFASAKFGKISEDTNGAVIDGINSSGDYSTQVIYFDPSEPSLMNPLYNYSGYSITKRSTQICSVDSDKDSIIEIPVCMQMGYNDTDEADSVAKLVNWSRYDTDSMTLYGVSSYILCLSDGYMLKIPTKWNDAVTARYDSKSRETAVYCWDYIDGYLTKGEKLITVRAFTKDDFAEDSGGFVELQTSGTTVFAYKLNSINNYLAISGEDVADMFSLVTNI